MTYYQVGFDPFGIKCRYLMNFLKCTLNKLHKTKMFPNLNNHIVELIKFAEVGFPPHTQIMHIHVFLYIIEVRHLREFFCK